MGRGSGKKGQAVSEYDKATRNRKRRERIEKEYCELLVQELIIALMENDAQSVRALAKEAGLSPTIIQGLRSKGGDPKISNFANILHALGAELKVVKDGKELATI